MLKRPGCVPMVLLLAVVLGWTAFTLWLVLTGRMK